MEKFKSIVRFVYVVYRVLWFCIVGIVCARPKTRHDFYWYRVHGAATDILNKVGVKIHINGIENIEKGKHYICMGNHRSYTDILIAFIAFTSVDCRITFMSKKSMFKVPLLGSAMKTFKVIGVDRANSTAAFKSLIDAVKIVKSGLGIVMFPEGTRTRDGKLQPLKKGGFVVAKRAEMDILPFAIEGSEKFMPRTGFGIFKHDVSITILPAIQTAGKKEDELIALVEKELKTIIS